MWQRLHLDGALGALAVPENQRFLVRLREPPGEKRNPIKFYRWNLPEAQSAADRLVQAYYPHECDETCGPWKKLDT
jgi:hypothetical protein